MTKERAIDVVLKLLAKTSDKAVTENEAMTAALKAQEIMAKYDIDKNEIIDVNDERIVETEIYVGTGNKWKYALATVIARNFCCKVFAYNTKYIVFYGHRKHTDIAKEVFSFLFKNGKRLSDTYYMKLYNNSLPTKGAKNAFLAGFIQGIQSILDKQCMSLMVVVPKDVEDSYNKMKEDSSFSSKTTKIRISTNENHYNEGYQEGKNVTQSRHIEMEGN